MDAASKRLECAWAPVATWWFTVLEKLLEHSWTDQRDICLVRLGISLLCPRYLDELSFDVPFYASVDRLLYLCAHETLHFFYFDKLQTLEHGADVSTFNYPHGAWWRSEVIAAVLLQDPEVQQYLTAAPKSCYVCSEKTFEALKFIWSSLSGISGRFDKFYSEVRGLAPEVAPQK